ncbi:glycosyltransferase family 9 protein [Thiohalorhabdus sp. Cl-TMA]|uniref:Glycosyltransferase family 9 protein n=1 Tax=Thiohalorhabdus methylotrophus TaxID=3242694 RepID=A0ABV4TTB5_9GAMM
MTPAPRIPDPPRSLCLLRLSAIGDVVNIVPLVRTLQRELPETRLTWIIGRTEAELVAGLEGVELLVLDKARTARSLTALWSRLRGRRFDVLLHAQAAWRANLVSTAVRAGFRIGYDRPRAKDFQRAFVHGAIHPGPSPHTLDGYFGFSRALGIKERHLEWGIPIPEAARLRARSLMVPDRRALVINPCASAGNRRNWLPERYARVADHAAARHGCQVLFTGGAAPRDHRFIETIRGAMAHPASNLAGRTSLKEMLALLGESTVLLAPDTGPVHMATAVGTPVIGLYAASDPARSGPYRSREWCVDRYPAASSRGLGRGAAAMRLIDVDSVTARLDRLLADQAQREAGRPVRAI